MLLLTAKIFAAASLLVIVAYIIIGVSLATLRGYRDTCDNWRDDF